jgi:hypothetical protein
VTARIIAQCLGVGLTGVAAWIIPAWGVKRLLPALERSGTAVVNYRGRTVSSGLGVVWLLWAAGVMLAGALGKGVFEIVRASTPSDGTLHWDFAQAFWPMRLGGVLPLVLAAYGFGLIDDLFGDRSVRGFRGHIGELTRGRLTTGALKLLGIGAAAAYVAADLASGVVGPNPETTARGWTATVGWLVAWALATLIIALSANLVNLMDVRPGRALKVYSLMATGGAAAIVLSVSGAVGAVAASAWTWYPSVPEIVGSSLGLLLLVLGPVFAAWRHDLGEHAMLGDAGANAAGALAGFLVALVLPLAGLAVVAAVLLAMNLVSEKVSYTEVIERNALLSRLDGLGRRRDGADGEGEDPAGTPGTDLPAGD